MVRLELFVGSSPALVKLHASRQIGQVFACWNQAEAHSRWRAWPQARTVAAGEARSSWQAQHVIWSLSALLAVIEGGSSGVESEGGCGSGATAGVEASGRGGAGPAGETGMRFLKMHC